MKKLFLFLLPILITWVFTSFKVPHSFPTSNSRPLSDTIHFPDEKHLKNVQQLTFEGDNAEAYFSFDSKWLIFQRKNEKAGIQCDQMFIGKIPQPGEKFQFKMISSGKGRTTCGSFTKDGKHIIYASTFKGADA